MANVSESSKLQVAIVGGGIAGLTAAVALRKHPNITVVIYDKATELKEIGASIALGPNGLRTLQRLGLDNAISDEVAYRGPSNIPMIYRHWKTNEVIGMDVHDSVTEYLHHTARYHRGHLQQELQENVPREIIRLKNLVSVDIDPETGVILEFEDGTVATADVLLGADGLRSRVRTSLVPDYKLKWSGWTAFRSVLDVSLTESISDLPPDSTHWWGPDTNFFASRLGKNAFTVVGGVNGNPKDPNAKYKSVAWDQDASVEHFREKYIDWNPVVKALTEITPSTRFYPNLSGPSLSTWVFGSRATLIGDAAHATGGSSAIDDAYCFYLALLSVFPLSATRKPTFEEIGKALKLYEATRKPHAERLLRKVHAANAAKAAKVATLETDVELRARAAKGSDTNWLHEHDVVAAFEETLRRSGKPREDTGEISARL